MNEADKLFLENPLKAIWIRMGVMEADLKKITNELENESLNEDFVEDNLNEY